MGCGQQAVQEFDEEVRAPWRPRLVLVQEPPASGAAPVVASRRQSVRPDASRAGSCRPPVSLDRRVTDVPAAPRPRVGRRRAAFRFTRRAHRLAIAVALCSGVVAGSLLGQLVPDHDGPELRLAGVSTVVVDQGDTLWSIATSAADGEDVRSVVDRIQELNGLRTTELVPGQVLLLP